MSNNSIRKAMHPHEIVERVAEFLKEGDLEAIVTMFHPDCKICFPLDEAPKYGHDGVREIFREFAKMKPTLIGKVNGEAINGDTALLQGEWRFETSDGTILAEGISTEVVKMLDDGSWVYFIDCPLGAPKLKTLS